MTGNFNLGELDTNKVLCGLRLYAFNPFFCYSVALPMTVREKVECNDFYVRTIFSKKDLVKFLSHSGINKISAQRGNSDVCGARDSENGRKNYMEHQHPTNQDQEYLSIILSTGSQKAT